MTNYTPEKLQKFESRIVKLFKARGIRVPVHLSGSVDGKLEKELIKIFKRIKPRDYVFSTHRNHYHYLLRTGDEEGLLREICGSHNGVCSGNAGSMHTISHKHRFYSSAIVAGCVAMAAGVARGLKEKDSKNMVWCFIGDAACDSGWFFEALRYAQGFNLPIIYII